MGGGGRKEAFFLDWFSKFKLTLGNCGLSRATVALAPRGAAGAGLHPTRETKNGNRRPKTVLGLKNFILLSRKAREWRLADLVFQVQTRS